jgi:lysine 2,3-aminomutase
MAYIDDRSTWFEGQGLWQHIPESDWQDWSWQLKNRLTTIEQLERYLTLTPEEKAGCLFADGHVEKMDLNNMDQGTRRRHFTLDP